VVALLWGERLHPLSGWLRMRSGDFSGLALKPRWNSASCMYLKCMNIKSVNNLSLPKWRECSSLYRPDIGIFYRAMGYLAVIERGAGQRVLLLPLLLETAGQRPLPAPVILPMLLMCKIKQQTESARATGPIQKKDCVLAVSPLLSCA
jgi:hypothetical protein